MQPNQLSVKYWSFVDSRSSTVDTCEKQKPCTSKVRQYYFYNIINWEHGGKAELLTRIYNSLKKVIADMWVSVDLTHVSADIPINIVVPKMYLSA